MSAINQCLKTVLYNTVKRKVKLIKFKTKKAS